MTPLQASGSSEVLDLPGSMETPGPGQNDTEWIVTTWKFGQGSSKWMKGLDLSRFVLV